MMMGCMKVEQMQIECDIHQSQQNISLIHLVIPPLQGLGREEQLILPSILAVQLPLQITGMLLLVTMQTQ